LNWQVGFLFWTEIEAGAADEESPIRFLAGRKQWAFLRFEQKI
jgi:hypothetical protein